MFDSKLYFNGQCWTLSELLITSGDHSIVKPLLNGERVMEAIPGFLGRVFNRSKTYRLIILVLTFISLIVIFGAYGPHPDVGSFWTYTSTLHQSFVNTTSQPWQLKKPIFNFGSQETNTSSSTLIDEHPAEKTDNESPSEYSMLDGIKVSPPAPPADTDNYLAICK